MEALIIDAASPNYVPLTIETNILYDETEMF